MTTSEHIACSHEAPAPRGRGTSRFLGVSWTTKDKRWVAHISCNNQQKNLGHFKDEVEAAKAYDAAAREAFGEWATPNFPTDAEREFAAQWYDRNRACAFFGVKRGVFKRWVREGRITGGRYVNTSNGRQRMFTLEDLQRLKQEMFGDDKLYKDGKTMRYHVPPTLITRQEAWAMFGVEISTWQRWERDGLITCGQRVPSGPKVYPVEEIKRLVEIHGVYSPPYPDPERPGVYRVPLGGYGMTRREAIIDAESLPLTERGSCHMASTSEGIEFVSISIDGEHIPLRRLVMGVNDRNRQIGHRNGDPLDCRRENLIVRSSRQRSWTKRKCRQASGQPCSSMYKGVTWDKQTERWRAVIRAFGKNYSLGRFDLEVDAAEAYDIAARKLFGEHAWLNFPEKGERGMSHDDAAMKIAA